MTTTRTPASYYTSKPPHCVSPRPYTDASQRFAKHGPVQGMDAPGAFESFRIICRIGFWPAVGLFACGAVAILAIVAFAGGYS